VVETSLEQYTHYLVLYSRNMDLKSTNFELNFAKLTPCLPIHVLQYIKYPTDDLLKHNASISAVPS